MDAAGPQLIFELEPVGVDGRGWVRASIGTWSIAVPVEADRPEWRGDLGELMALRALCWWAAARDRALALGLTPEGFTGFREMHMARIIMAGHSAPGRPITWEDLDLLVNGPRDFDYDPERPGTCGKGGFVEGKPTACGLIWCVLFVPEDMVASEAEAVRSVEIWARRSAAGWLPDWLRWTAAEIEREHERFGGGSFVPHVERHCAGLMSIIRPLLAAEDRLLTEPLGGGRELPRWSRACWAELVRAAGPHVAEGFRNEINEILASGVVP